MRHTRTIVVLLLWAIAETTNADTNNKFVVKSHGRFEVEAIPYLNKGSELQEKGDLQGARRCFDTAIQKDKYLWPAYIDRAQLFASAGQWDLALQDCNTAVHLRPDFYRTFIVRAEVYRGLGRCRDGLADLDKIISFHRDAETDSLALSNRAQLRVSCRDAAYRDPKLALADAKQACELTRWRIANYIGMLGRACAANGDFEAAIRYEQQAINSGKYTAKELESAKQRLSHYEHRQAH